MEKQDIVVVGGGPAGLALAVEAKSAGIDRVVVLEKAARPCDTIVSLYHEGKRVDAVYRQVQVEPLGRLAFKTESREEFLTRMAGVVADFGLDIRLGHECRQIKSGGPLFEVHTSSGASFAAPIVVLAIGVFGRPVKPSYAIPKEVKNLVHFSLPKEPLHDKRLLVVGGGDSAVEIACFLSEKNQVTLSYRRSEFFRVNVVNLCDLDKCYHCGDIELKLGTDIEGLAAEAGRVRVSFRDGGQLSYDRVFYALGGSSPQAFLEGAGVKYNGRQPLVNEFGETNIARLFLAGDLVAEKGTIMAAFNSAVRVVQGIIAAYPQL